MTPRFSAAALIVLLIALAGCAPASVADPEPTTTLQPAPTPTFVQGAEPHSTISLDCDDLFTDAEASEVAGLPVVLRDAGSTTNNATSIAARQAGVLTCAWDVSGELSWRHALSVSILAGADADFAGRASGGAPENACEVYDGLSSLCSANLLVNGYWAQLWSFSGGTDIGRSQEVADGSWVSAIADVTTAIEQAGSPRPRWQEPPFSFTGAICDGMPPRNMPPVSSPEGAGSQRVIVPTCVTTDGWNVTVVPGGAWGVGIMAEQEQLAADYEIGPWHPLSVPGATDALFACGEACVSIASISGSAIFMYNLNSNSSTIETDAIAFFERITMEG